MSPDAARSARRLFLFHRKLRPCEIKALRAGCARRNSDILPLCGIAAARKVFKPLKIEGKGELKWACPLYSFIGNFCNSSVLCMNCHLIFRVPSIFSAKLLKEILKCGMININISCFGRMKSYGYEDRSDQRGWNRPGDRR